MQKGSCLCGAVSFEINGPILSSDACHCRECRKQSGHYWASADIARESLTLNGADQLTWFKASERVRRGFCSTCGGFLFWDPIGKDRIAVALGALDTPTGTQLEKHIFVAEKGDYYEIADGLPQS